MSLPLSALLEGEPATPQPDRAHHLLVAQRLAEAVAAVHAAGGVIGNLDAQRALVAPDGTVALSDNAAATPEASTSAAAYTAPELQGSLPGRIRPEAQHDAFALAVLLFQLLMAGNHPYAGKWSGGGNLPDIPKAIQLGLYAYGGSAATPPPGAPALSTLEPGLAELFARSFGATSAIFRNRPTAAVWAQALATARQTKAAAPHSPVTDLPAPLQKPDPGSSTLTPMAAATPAATSEAPPAAAPDTPPPNPALAVPEPRPPLPTTLPDEARRPRPGTGASPAKRTAPRHTALPRAVPPDDPSGGPPRLAQSERSWSSLWNDLVSDLLYEMAAWRQAITVVFVFLLFLVVFVLAERNDYWANPGTRPTVWRANRVPATQTPQPRLTATRAAVINSNVASFGSNFDVSDGVIPSTGERFSAYVRDRALRLEAFGKGARGKAMFDAAPAQGEFIYTVHVGETTGQGEILIYLREPDSNRTWVFAIDPGTSKWGLYEELPSSNRLKTVIARHDYGGAIARQPLRTIAVTRKGERISLRINDVAVYPRIARAMPQIDGPVTVGVGAMIPDTPAYADEPFVVTVDRVAMHADEQ